MLTLFIRWLKLRTTRRRRKNEPKYFVFSIDTTNGGIVRDANMMLECITFASARLAFSAISLCCVIIHLVDVDVDGKVVTDTLLQ
jgi:hypothetical protein